MSNTDNLIEELSFRLKDTPYDHLLTRAVQRLVTLNSENAQLKENNVELVEALEDVSDFFDYAWGNTDMNLHSFTLLEEVIRKVQSQIAKIEEK